MWDKYMLSYKLMVEGLSDNTDKTVQKSVDMYIQNVLKRQKETPKTLIFQGFRGFFILFPLYCCRRLTCYIVNNAVYILDLVYYSVAAALKHFIW